jgi:cytochrome P450 monooxygenase
MESLLLKGDRSITFLVCTVLAVVLGVLYPRWRRHREIKAIIRRHGCKDPHKYPHQDRWGSDMLQLRKGAVKEGRFFKLYESQFELYGKTFEENRRGKRLINTTEPVNVQQVAALAVEDYGKDLERLQAQSPFFGPSIFSDEPIWKQARPNGKAHFRKS